MTTHRVTRLVILTAAASAVSWTAPVTTAEAGKRQKSGVAVCSWYGNGCTRAPIRRGRFGPEMRLKGGTWTDCRGDCRETLREETVDFWETQNIKAKAFGP